MASFFTIKVEVSGSYNDEDLKEYLQLLLGCGACSQDNPFVDEESEVDIIDVEID